MSTDQSTTRNDAAFVEANATSLRSPEASGRPDMPTQRYTETQDTTRHSIQTVDGHRTQVDVTTDTDTHLSGDFDNRVMELVEGAIKEREARENKRANHRNFNRMLTLFGALVIGLIVTYVLQHQGIPGLVTLPKSTHTLAPYAFVITVALDMGLAAYSFIRHY